tara:strand:+ start:31491 stop:31976 length:486 start_codon:yes stop_codon:yes gene_type:complete
MPHLEIDIAVQDERWTDIVPNIESFTNIVVSKALSGLLTAIDHADISIVLVDDTFIRDLNKNYRGKDKATNVLSFPQTEPNTLENPTPLCSLGDIIIAFETIQRESEEQNKTMTDHYAHMLVHGCLHLLHFDHEDDQEAEIMEAREIDILKTLNIKNPYQI